MPLSGVSRRWNASPFAALEEPAALVGDIRAFFRELR
jgi:hypothetical protein